jgi:hypothetical protein
MAGPEAAFPMADPPGAVVVPRGEVDTTSNRRGKPLRGEQDSAVFFQVDRRPRVPRLGQLLVRRRYR